ncbi:uncharacterized protein RHIMIDRAFT_258055 [Rhizopus microsporus ATCC 52813]|uniref:RRM domain-containing protein n=1 Tax=Rhizopus microsporus ATCC 52813 TaxID=1340429 RepID=A0A2G4SQ03_RHIZD|nr:uncharacterized protein RHIMIDRAFT_258055 [Rhizopus microsporus ATCC 52813]PHZ10858.1 hypothetical protein RHIMIDRAFT_258055 [Rhizopus microsporus ATCC 52813]
MAYSYTSNSATNTNSIVATPTLTSPSTTTNNTTPTLPPPTTTTTTTNNNTFFEGPPTRTLWMGELDPWMDDNYLRQLWWSMGQEVTCRISIDKYGGTYAFIDFTTHEAASKSLISFNGTQIPNTNKIFKLNWSNRDGNGMPLPQRPTLMANFLGDYCIFVGDLGADVDDNILLAAFQSRYKSAASAKVMVDPATGFSRGFGFVKFFDEGEQQRSLEEMQGVYVGASRIRVSVARPRAKFEMGTVVNGPEEITTVFVGGLNNTITEEELRAYFGAYGSIIAVKIIPLKNIAFIQYEKRVSAERAIAELNGSHLGGAKLRLSFGRTQLNMGPGVHYLSSYQPQTQSAMLPPTSVMPQPPPPPVIPQPTLDLVDPMKPVSIEQENKVYLLMQESMEQVWTV